MAEVLSLTYDEALLWLEEAVVAKEIAGD